MGYSRSPVLVTLIVTSLLAGCDGKQTASADNFARALQRYFDDHPECIAMPTEFPVQFPAHGADLLKLQADALVSAGLVSASPIDGGSSVRYVPTGAGERVLRRGADSFIGGTTLCFAQRHVVKVISFTPPTELLGVKSSQVTFEFRLTAMAPWAAAAPIQEAFPEIQGVSEAPTHTRTEGLVLTSDGWVDEHLIQ